MHSATNKHNFEYRTVNWLTYLVNIKLKWQFFATTMFLCDMLNCELEKEFSKGALVTFIYSIASLPTKIYIYI